MSTEDKGKGKGKGSQYVESLTYGADLICAPDLIDAIREYGGTQKFSFICAPICHPRNRRYLLSGTRGAGAGASAAERVLVPLLERQQQQFPWTRSDTILPGSLWSTAILGKLSPWLSLDSPSDRIRVNSSRVFWQEITWAAHLGLSAVLLPPPSAESYAHYAHFINEASLRLSSMQLWLRIPLSVFGTVAAAADEKEEEEEDNNNYYYGTKEQTDSWSIWNRIRLLCDHNDKLSVALEITEDLPEDNSALQRWIGEPVKAVIVPTSVFLTSDDSNGMPYLSTRHRSFLASIISLKPHIIISGAPHNNNSNNNSNSSSKENSMYGDLSAYRDCIEDVRRSIPAMTPQEVFESPYYDFLQAPLQPLADNLESQTYEVFEKDPVKYVRYEEAMAAALRDMSAPLAGSRPLVLMVVGAGRGPLVDAALRASASTGVPLRVYAVEKNPNALVTLRNKRVSQAGWDAVTVVESDMREWEAPEKADILVSELLGSFGDNELSPECLDGAQRFLREDGGISIPYSYTSYVAPVATPRLFNDIKDFGDTKHFEIPYIVKLHNYYQMAPSKQCFTFTHPNKAARIDNTRYTCVSFVNSVPTIVHGLAGYFQAMLYKNIHISINPQTFSVGMFSWFPVFFPLRTPVVLPAPGLSVDVHLWRQADKNKVWYEWAVMSSAASTPVHNPNGRSYYVGLR